MQTDTWGWVLLVITVISCITYQFKNKIISVPDILGLNLNNNNNFADNTRHTQYEATSVTSSLIGDVNFKAIINSNKTVENY